MIFTYEAHVAKVTGVHWVHDIFPQFDFKRIETKAYPNNPKWRHVELSDLDPGTILCWAPTGSNSRWIPYTFALLLPDFTLAYFPTEYDAITYYKKQNP